MRKAMTLKERIESEGRKLQEKEAALRKQRDRLASLRDTEAKRIGRLAVDAGLADLDILDTDLTKAFGDLAARFRKGTEAAE